MINLYKKKEVKTIFSLNILTPISIIINKHNNISNSMIVLFFKLINN